MPPGCHTSSTALNLTRRWEPWPSRPSNGGIISRDPYTVGWSKQVQQTSSEGCMYMAANSGINLNAIPWKWYMPPTSHLIPHVVEDQLWIIIINPKSKITYLPIECLCSDFFWGVMGPTSRQHWFNQPINHPPVETSKRPRLKHPTNERNWRPHTRRFPQGTPPPHILRCGSRLMRGFSELQSEKKRLNDHVEEKYHINMMKLQLVITSHLQVKVRQTKIGFVHTHKTY